MSLEIIKNILIVVVSIGIIISSVRLYLERDRKNMVYARLHIAGVIDIGCIIILLVLNQYLLALLYLVLCPFAAHAIANANYYDTLKKDEEQN